MLQEISIDAPVSPLGDDLAAWMPDVQQQAVPVQESPEPPEPPQAISQGQIESDTRVFQEPSFRSSLVKRDLQRTFAARRVDSPDQRTFARVRADADPTLVDLAESEPLPPVEDDFSQL